MAQIKKINIKGVEYDIVGSGSGGDSEFVFLDKTLDIDNLENIDSLDGTMIEFTAEEVSFLLEHKNKVKLIRFIPPQDTAQTVLYAYESGSAELLEENEIDAMFIYSMFNMYLMILCVTDDNGESLGVGIFESDLESGGDYNSLGLKNSNYFGGTLDQMVGEQTYTMPDTDAWVNNCLPITSQYSVDGPDINTNGVFYLMYAPSHSPHIYTCIGPEAFYDLDLEGKMITKRPIVSQEMFYNSTNDYSFTLPNDSTFLSVQGTSGCTATTNASSTPLAINSAVTNYFGYPQLLVRNFSPTNTNTTPAAAAPTFMLAETGAGTSTGKQLELFYSPTWATENPALFTDTTTANLFHVNSMTNQEWYSLGTITIREGQWQGKKSLAGLSFNVNLTDDFNISSNTSGTISINHIISLDLPMAGNRCIWQGMSPEFEVYQGITAIDNVSMSSIPSGKVYKRNYVGNAYSWIASSSDTTLNNPVCFKLMHAFGPEAGLASSSNNSKYYNYQYESTGSARLQNDWTRVTCNVDEATIDIANTKVISVTQLHIQLQY